MLISQRDYMQTIGELGSPYPEIRMRAISALENEASSGRSIVTAMPVLVEILKGTDDALQHAAIWPFLIAAFHGQDISVAVETLQVLLNHPDKNTSQHAAKTFTCHAVNQQRWADIECMLDSGERHIREGVLGSLWNKRDSIPGCAFFRMVFRHFLVYEEPITHTIHQLIRGASSLAELEEMESIAESGFAGWLKRQPQGISLGKIQAQANVTYLVQTIAHRKAQLAKEKDGELLTGETVPKPVKDKQGMYRAALRSA